MSISEIWAALVLAFLAGLAVATLLLLRAGRFTVVIVPNSLRRPQGRDGRFLTDRQIATGAALETVRQSGGAGR